MSLIETTPASTDARLEHLAEHDASRIAAGLADHLAAAEHWHSVGIVTHMHCGAMTVEFMPATDVAARSLRSDVRELALAE